MARCAAACAALGVPRRARRDVRLASPLTRAAQVSATVDGQASNVYLWRKDRARITAA